MNTELIKVDIWLGTVESQMRHVLKDNGLECQSRGIWKDDKGVTQRISEWEPLSTMYFGKDHDQRKWWRFWE